LTHGNLSRAEFPLPFAVRLRRRKFPKSRELFGKWLREHRDTLLLKRYAGRELPTTKRED
jgi:hypothetical protein